ncbi:Protein argonaute-2 [Lucilia cuprina]|nr:Protein argonaute-2 [Lucilia cuprina]
MLKYLKQSFASLHIGSGSATKAKTPVYAEVNAWVIQFWAWLLSVYRLKNVNKNRLKTLSNLCLKINVKLGWHHYRFLYPLYVQKFSMNPVIFWVPMVTHPPAGDNKKPSIAAVVGLWMLIPHVMCATVRVQQHRQEIIQELYKYGITFIVVQKRHHTRLFVLKKKNKVVKSGNIPALVQTVDVGITHPTELISICAVIKVFRVQSRPYTLSGFIMG